VRIEESSEYIDFLYLTFTYEHCFEHSLDHCKVYFKLLVFGRVVNLDGHVVKIAKNTWRWPKRCIEISLT
jgi:hypothetical protein